MKWVEDASAETNKQSRYPTVVSVCIVMTTLMMTVVALRTYVRSCLVRSLGMDDYMTLLSAVGYQQYTGQQQFLTWLRSVL